MSVMIIGGKKNFILHSMTNYFQTFYFLVAGFFSTSDYCDRHFYLSMLVSISHESVSNKKCLTIIGGKKNFTLHSVINYFQTFLFLVVGFFSTSDYCDRHFLE
jgi:hypothetical protein